MTSKKKAERIHAHRNALSRYGLNYTQKVRDDLVHKIHSGEAILLAPTSNRVKSFAVKYQGQYYPIVYDNQRKEIVTFLPPEYLDRYKDKLNP